MSGSSAPSILLPDSAIARERMLEELPTDPDAFASPLARLLLVRNNSPEVEVLRLIAGAHSFLTDPARVLSQYNPTAAATTNPTFNQSPNYYEEIRNV